MSVEPTNRVEAILDRVELIDHVEPIVRIEPIDV